jgi:uncharacterized SAM-binding protein YcdF (DUF218 family)
MFLIKKIIAYWFAPLPIIIALLLLGLFLLWRRPKHWAGKLSIATGILLLILLSVPPIANNLLYPIEHVYRPYRDISPPVEFVSVLGCRNNEIDDIPITSALADCSLIRLVEGIRIMRMNPNSQLLLSGYGGTHPISNANMMKKVAVSMGVNASRIKTFSSPRDTFEEAAAVKQHIGDRTLALVTSASHLPRAMSLYIQHGLDPVPAPTEHLAQSGYDMPWYGYAPRSHQLKKAERWWYETLAQLWVAVSGDPH